MTRARGALTAARQLPTSPPTSFTIALSPSSLLAAPPPCATAGCDAPRGHRIPDLRLRRRRRRLRIHHGHLE
ncbi:uncharacterized protein EKO05_0009744 [Ascochyta rabiei]|uniref:uncharacterized protein n=1 Tax=Didymella rabiei TaxID=5454 RepID=UPI0022072472|nr:uncharacterized protein EKO05_0009744 [Ascochyta rabiei]UPX19484.1 hypothetical protein EKO05_0009744 [Ascochyta rabiei]